MQSLKHIALQTGIHWISTQGLLFNEVSLDKKLSKGQEQKHLESIRTLCEGKPRPFLIDARKVHGAIEYDTVKFFVARDEISEVCIAEAFVVNSLIAQLLLNSYLQSNPPCFLYRVFTSIDKAVTWLNTINISKQAKNRLDD